MPVGDVPRHLEAAPLRLDLGLVDLTRRYRHRGHLGARGDRPAAALGVGVSAQRVVRVGIKAAGGGLRAAHRAVAARLARRRARTRRSPASPAASAGGLLSAVPPLTAVVVQRHRDAGLGGLIGDQRRRRRRVGAGRRRIPPAAAACLVAGPHRHDVGLRVVSALDRDRVLPLNRGMIQRSKLPRRLAVGGIRDVITRRMSRRRPHGGHRAVSTAQRHRRRRRRRRGRVGRREGAGRRRVAPAAAARLIAGPHRHKIGLRVVSALDRDRVLPLNRGMIQRSKLPRRLAVAGIRDVITGRTSRRRPSSRHRAVSTAQRHRRRRLGRVKPRRRPSRRRPSNDSRRQHGKRHRRCPNPS